MISIIAATVFLLLSITFLILYLRTMNKYIKIDEELQYSKKINNTLNSNLLSIKNELTTQRIGYYSDSVNILSKEDRLNNKTGEVYTIITHVKELDRYTNGMSKITITNMEITSGFDIYQYEYVKTCMRNKFQSVKKTSDIEWLESEESIKEMRKQKLEKLMSIKNGVARRNCSP